jgi:polyhydroxyalkanoate synthase
MATLRRLEPREMTTNGGPAAEVRNTAAGRNRSEEGAVTRQYPSSWALQHAGTSAPPGPEFHAFANLDRALQANLARLTLGLSPTVLTRAYLEWLLHLATSPGKQAQLLEKAIRKAVRFLLYASHAAVDPNAEPCIEPLPQDHRFTGQDWQRWPYNVISQAFLLTQQWWHNATTEIPGVPKRDQEILAFAARQFLDVFAPSSLPWINSEVVRTPWLEGGRNLVRGARNFMEDGEQSISGKPPVGAEQFQVGVNVAATPGKVVYRNPLIELIQYLPTTETVSAKPFLIVPAWIMKYYILDLSSHNSLIKYLVDRGHTVFILSWRNPTAEDHDLGMDDYRRLGVMTAPDAVSAILPDTRIHAVGYCLGGALLTIAAAAMARDDDDRLKTLTLLAGQTDFTEAGELMLFVNETQLAYLENLRWDQGYLDTHQMSGAFQLLRPNDLIWSRLVHDYLLGRRQSMTDLMAWNADQTRLPYRMHSQYLRSLFLGNDLAQGRYLVDERPITISDIRAPLFAVGTVCDHVAPWRSVYKIHLLADADEVTFVLTSGGHNAGIVSEPGHRGRSYQMTTRKEGDKYVNPETWQLVAPRHEGSWWAAW